MSEAECAEASTASEYHLSWNNYEASIASFLKILSTAKDGEEDLSDVTISCAGGRQFPAHRLVLATCSSYFRQLFVGRSVAAPGSGCHSHPIVYIPDLPDRVMEHLLAFMYCGETTVPTHLLLPLIEAAKLLGIQGLTEPNNIEGLVEEVTTANIPAKVEQDEQNNTEPAMTNGKFRGLEQMVVKEPKLERQEMAKPDSSNSLVFPALPPGMPRLSLASPMALGLASGHLGSGHLASGHLGLPGLDSLHQLGLAQGVRRKSSPKLTSPNSAIASSSQVNSSSGVNYPHYPPTEDPTRPFACAQCPKRFRMKHHLKEHTLIHSGEMPFSCHLCPKRFNRSYTLKNHMKLHSAGSLVPGIKFDVPDIKFDVPGIKFQQDDPSSSDMIVPLLGLQASFH